MEDDAALAIARTTGDPEKNVLARSFGEVRRFALLSFAETSAWASMQRWRRRVRWALSPPLALRRCIGSGSKWSIRPSPCTRSCRPARGRRLTQRPNGRTSGRPSNICRSSPPLYAVWMPRTGGRAVRRKHNGYGTTRVSASGAHG